MFKLIFVFVFLIIYNYAIADITFTNGEWSTTFNCSTWVQGNDENIDPACDGLDQGGGWVCSETSLDTIISAANNPLGTGKGYRHYAGDGVNVNGGGVVAVFTTKQTELWIRVYLRYESGFGWSTLNYDKLMYIRTESTTDILFELNEIDKISATAQGTSNAYAVKSTTNGWQTIYGTTSNGSWFCLDLYIKMDTNQTDGIGRIWLNGVLIKENTAVDWSNGNATDKLGWKSILIGSNQSSPSNGGCKYLDYDDIVIRNQVPLKRDAANNPMIGPLDWPMPGSMVLTGGTGSISLTGGPGSLMW